MVEKLELQRRVEPPRNAGEYEMADIIDTAAEIEEFQRNAALSAHRLNRNAVSAERCEECDEPISERRRAAVPGCQTCAECQSVIELRNKQRGL